MVEEKIVVPCVVHLNYILWTLGLLSRSGTAYPSWAPDFTLGF